MQCIIMLRRVLSSYSLYILCIIAGCTAKATPDHELTGVLHSPIQLPCAVDDTIDIIETVNWYTNHSNVETLRVSYFPSEDYYAVDHEGYEIYEEKNLRIASLGISDSGLFRCKVLSSASYEYTSFTQLNVLEGCRLPSYPDPLNTDCSVENVLSYGSWCNFTCSPNFQLIGNDSVQCTSTGELSSGPPHCKALRQCSIPVLDQHLVSSGQCQSGSTIGAESQCTFHCSSGYTLKGNETLRCQTNGHFDATFPSCDEIDDGNPQVNLGLLLGLTIPLLVVIVILVSGIYIYIKGQRNRYGKHEAIPFQGITKDHEADEQEHFKDHEADEQEHFKDHEADEQEHFKAWIDGSIQLLCEHLPAQDFADYKTLVSAILKSLHDAENEVITSIPILDESVFRLIDNYVEKIDKSTFVNPNGALATYYFILISYMGDLAKREHWEGHILSLTVSDKSSSHESSATSEQAYLIDSHGSDPTVKLLSAAITKDDKEKFDQYFTTIHIVFAHLLASARGSIADENDRRRRTGKVCKEIMKKTRPKIDGHVDDKSSGRGMSFQSDGNQNLGSYRFAELCVNKLNMCSSISDKITLRQTILEQFCT